MFFVSRGTPTNGNRHSTATVQLRIKLEVQFGLNKTKEALCSARKLLQYCQFPYKKYAIFAEVCGIFRDISTFDLFITPFLAEPLSGLLCSNGMCEATVCEKFTQLVNG
jgi:hypothetical protein